MRVSTALFLALLVLLTACSGGSNAPKGWKPLPGATAAWYTGNGATAQDYSYATANFSGSLQDLASQVTIDNLMGHRGARFLGSIPFPACPGAAGLATFLLPEGRTLQQGFAVHGGRAIRTTYLRPAGTSADPNVTQAMQTALCTL